MRPCQGKLPPLNGGDMRKYVGLLLSVWTASLCAQVDLAIFSYDRPMQLYALLESIDLNVQGLSRQSVIYRASSAEFEVGYALVKQAFPRVNFMAQSHQRAAIDFKPLVLEAAFSPLSLSPYVLFAVDDIVITRPIDLKRACAQLEGGRYWGCFFRLGLDITHCYMVDRSSGVPAKGRLMDDGFFTWKIADGQGDWGYPNNVDFTLYRKQQVAPFFLYSHYTTPNNLEASWANYANSSMMAICPQMSCLVNIPMNVVSQFNNRQMHYKDTQELLDLFLEGYTIDIAKLQGVEHNSPHAEINPSFIKRSF